ncbi:Cell division protein FtsL [hydrothermal vent metagenome]|uniref:Cell division protein FtsL n=1 Tax=hydrothermal vent metagenome TaxID=652676 RepID=A0A3B1AKP2_9ZZZZ
MNKLLVVMILAVLVSAVGVIEAKHQSRKRFVALQALEKVRDQMNVEWGQLQLEQGTWATHSRVERLAREKLHMVNPKMDEVVIVEQVEQKP